MQLKAIIFLFILSFFHHALAEPVLQESSITYLNTSLFTTEWEFGLVQLDFDQDLYINEGLVCPLGDLAKPEPPTCQPCDFTSRKGGFLGQPNCAALFAQQNCCDPGITDLTEWCNPQHSFESLSLSDHANSTSSPVYTLQAGDVLYLRFHIDESRFWDPMRIFVRYFEGNANLYYSNTQPYPSSDDYLWGVFDLAFGYGYAQTFVDLCPAFLPSYSPGTYVIAVEALIPSKFYIEVFHPSYSPPPVLPADAFSCADVAKMPEFADVFCADEHATHEFLQDLPDGSFFPVLMPVQAGCQLISVAINAYYEDAVEQGSDFDLFCFSLNPNTPIAERPTSAAARYRVGPDTLTIGICPDQPIILGCTLQIWASGRAYYRWSSQAAMLRTLISDLPSYEFSVSAALGASPLMFPKSNPDSFPSTICIDWGLVCRSAWNTYGATDPIYMWPLPLDTSGEQIYFPLLSLDLYSGVSLMNQFSTPMNNRIVIPVVLSTSELLREPQFTKSDFLESGSFLFLWFTDKEGNLPSLGQTSSSGKDIPSHFRSIAVSAIPNEDLANYCDFDPFQSAERVAEKYANALIDADSSATSLKQSYFLQVTTASLSYSSCRNYFEQILDRSEEMVEQDTKACAYNNSDPRWIDDPCCNFALDAIEYCYPRSQIVQVATYSNSNLTQSDFFFCTNPDCVESYIQDFTQASNVRECSSSSDLVDRDLNSIRTAIRSCRQQSGFGANFEGISCTSDADCLFAPFQCSLQARICAIDLPTAENAFLDCFLNAIPIGFLTWIEDHVIKSKTSNNFDAIKAAARKSDCMSQDIFNLTTRNRYQYAVDGSCGEYCPTIDSLDMAFRTEPNICYQTCYATWNFATVLQSDCDAISTTSCSVENIPSCSTSDSVCAYCDPLKSNSCQTSSILPTNENDCMNAIACELPDGSIRFDLTADECLQFTGQCNVDCAGTSCQSNLDISGICEFLQYSTEDQCQNSDLPDPVFLQDRCVSEELNQAECSSLNGNWVSCQTNPTCNGFATPTYQYLQCFVAPWRECLNENECQSSGLCTDRPYTVRVDPDTLEANLGGCFTSGYFGFYSNGEMTCTVEEYRTKNGCLRSDINISSECQNIRVTEFGTEWQIWLNPAQSEAQCRNASVAARYGCLIESTENRINWYSPEDCQQIFGTPSYAFDWIPGVWVGAQIRNLTWVKPEVVPSATWQEDRLSFPTIESWSQGYLDYQSSFTFKSNTLCEYELINTPLSPLVCSCQSAQDGCFEDRSRLSLVELISVCKGDEITIDTPSSSITFTSNSISDGCITLYLSEINAEYLRAPPPPPPVSIRVAERNSLDGTVIEGREVVGQLVSPAGIVFDITPDRSTYVNVTLCFPISLATLNSTNPSYSIPDVGESADFSEVRPLKNNVVIFPDVGDKDEETWCTQIELHIPNKKTRINRFALVRKEQTSQDNHNGYSTTDIILVYTLAALYAVAFLVILAVCVYILYTKLKTGFPVHFYIYSLPVFLVLCIFRMVYFFAYPSALWESNQLANFVVFEIPTFLYFSASSVVLHAISRPIARLNSSKGKLGTSLLVLFLVLIWLLFVATVIAEAVLVDNNTGSDCVGRVPYDISSLSDQLRVLSLTYQSLVIFFILLQSLLFVLAISYFLNFSKISALRGVLISSMTIVVGLVARCILFIIYLGIYFVSTIYVFITLTCTEVIVFVILAIFWLGRHKQAFDSFSDSSKSSDFGAHPSRTSNITREI